MKNFISFLYKSVLNKEVLEPELLIANFGIKNLFIPPHTDNLGFLKQKYARVLDFTVPIPDEEIQEAGEEEECKIDYIQEFFENLKNEKFIYS